MPGRLFRRPKGHCSQIRHSQNVTGIELTANWLSWGTGGLTECPTRSRPRPALVAPIIDATANIASPRAGWGNCANAGVDGCQMVPAMIADGVVHISA